MLTSDILEHIIIEDEVWKERNFLNAETSVGKECILHSFLCLLIKSWFIETVGTWNQSLQMKRKFHTQNSAVHVKAIKSLCRLAIK